MPVLWKTTTVRQTARSPASRIGPKSTSSPGLPVRRRLRYPTAPHPGGLPIPSTEREERMDLHRPPPQPTTPPAPPLLDRPPDRKLPPPPPQPCGPRFLLPPL